MGLCLLVDAFQVQWGYNRRYTTNSNHIHKWLCLVLTQGHVQEDGNRDPVIHVTKGSVSYLSSPCFSTSLGGIGGPARGIHGILAVMYWISVIRGGAPPENGYGFNSHG